MTETITREQFEWARQIAIDALERGTYSDDALAELIAGLTGSEAAE